MNVDRALRKRKLACNLPIRQPTRDANGDFALARCQRKRRLGGPPAPLRISSRLFYRGEGIGEGCIGAHRSASGPGRLSHIPA